MSRSFKGNLFWNPLFRLVTAMLLLVLVSACSTEDKPFSLTGDENSPAVVPVGEGSGDGGGSDGCIVEFQGTMQLKVSTSGSVGDKLDAQPVPIDNIPFEVEGDSLILKGDTFPSIILTNLHEQVDMRVTAVPGTESSSAVGADGSMEFLPGLDLRLEILSKGTTENFIQGFDTLPGIVFTTGEVSVTGNLNNITEVGMPLQDDLSINLVLGTILPDNFTNLGDTISSAIGGGALTAFLEGSLTQDPKNCSAGGGSGGGGGGGNLGIPPTDFSISDTESGNKGTIDFGTTFVVPTVTGNGQTILDCSEAINRGPMGKTLYLRNTSSSDLTIHLMDPVDNDRDTWKDPGCSGKSEFVRGMIHPQGAATCQSTPGGEQQFPSLSCTVPAGDETSYLVIPALYVPYNLIEPDVAPEEGGEDPGVEEPPAEGEGDTGGDTSDGSDGGDSGGGGEPAAVVEPDTAVLNFEYSLEGGAIKTYQLELVGRTEKDVSDSFALGKVNNGNIESRLSNNEVLKINLPDPAPATQDLMILNSGTDVWEEVTVTFVSGEESVYTASLTDTTLPASGATGEGQLPLELTLTPGAGQVFNDRMVISMIRAGSKTADNPTGTVATLNIDLAGTVGVPPLDGTVYFQIDFLAGKIAHSITTNPVESLDFRMYPDQAPPPIEVIFGDSGQDGVKTVTFNVENKSARDMTQSERETALRILNAQATVGKSGGKLVAGEGADKCFEPSNVNQPYQDKDCSYFYFGIFGDEPGIYKEASGEFAWKGSLRIENPYHSDIAGRWLPSDPGGSPTNILDTTVEVTLTTLTFDVELQEIAGEEVDLLPDVRIPESALNLKGLPLGDECPEDIFNHQPDVGTLEEKHPHFLCYVTPNGRYVRGRPVSVREDNVNERDVVLSGFIRFPSETTDPNLPWFMGENGGSYMPLAIQGRFITQ